MQNEIVLTGEAARQFRKYLEEHPVDPEVVARKRKEAQEWLRTKGPRHLDCGERHSLSEPCPC